MAVNIGDLTNKPAPEDTDLIELDTGSASFNTSKQQFLAGIQGEVDNKLDLDGGTMSGAGSIRMSRGCELIVLDENGADFGNVRFGLLGGTEQHLRFGNAQITAGFSITGTLGDAQSVNVGNNTGGDSTLGNAGGGDVVLSAQFGGTVLIDNEFNFIDDITTKNILGKIWYGNAGFNVTNPADTAGLSVLDTGDVTLGTSAGDTTINASGEVSINGAGGISLETDATASGDFQVDGTLTGPTIEGKLDREVTKTTVDAFTTGQVGVLTDPGVVLADASTEATARGQVLIALENIGAGQTGRFAFLGLVAQPDVSAPGRYYLTTTPGTISTARPVGSGEVVRVVGEQDDPGIINLIPDSTIIVLL